MSRLSSRTAGKRVCVWFDKDDNCERVHALLNVEDETDYNKQTNGGTVMLAGDACRKGYITSDEVESLFPFENVIVSQPSTTNTSHSTRKIVTKTYTSRWGLTDENYPRWVHIGNKGYDPKLYLEVEERKATFKVILEDGKEEPIKYESLECIPVEVKRQ